MGQEVATEVREDDCPERREENQTAGSSTTVASTSTIIAPLEGLNEEMFLGPVNVSSGISGEVDSQMRINENTETGEVDVPEISVDPQLQSVLPCASQRQWDRYQALAQDAGNETAQSENENSEFEEEDFFDEEEPSLDVGYPEWGWAKCLAEGDLIKPPVKSVRKNVATMGKEEVDQIPITNAKMC